MELIPILVGDNAWKWIECKVVMDPVPIHKGFDPGHPSKLKVSEINEE